MWYVVYSINKSSGLMSSIKSEFYNKMFNPWIEKCEYNGMKKVEQSMEERYDTWMYEFMVRNNCSMRMVRRCVSEEQMFKEYVNGNEIVLSRYAESIREEKERLIREHEDDEYNLSFRENEETEDW